MKGGLLMLAMAKGKPKGKPDPMAPEEPEAEDDESGGSEEEFARLAVQAIKDGDEDSAVSALVSAIKACVKKAEDGEYPPAA